MIFISILIILIVLFLISLASYDGEFMALVFGLATLVWLVLFVGVYAEYTSAKARIELYDEAIALKTQEFKEGLDLQRENNLFGNKQSDNLLSSNADNPIGSTQKYLQAFHRDRAKERENYLEAKRRIYAIERGIFSAVAWLYK